MVKPKIHKIKFNSSQKHDIIQRATRIGCEILLLPMGDSINFTSTKIKYTIKRQIEK